MSRPIFSGNDFDVALRLKAEFEALAKTIHLTCRDGVSKNLHDAYTWANTAIVELSAPSMIGLTLLNAVLNEIAKNLVGVTGTQACLAQVDQTLLELRERQRRWQRQGSGGGFTQSDLFDRSTTVSQKCPHAVVETRIRLFKEYMVTHFSVDRRRSENAPLAQIVDRVLDALYIDGQQRARFLLMANQVPSTVGARVLFDPLRRRVRPPANLASQAETENRSTDAS